MLTTQEKKQRLIALEAKGKELEKAGEIKDWRAYNRDMNRYTKDYTSDTAKVRETDNDRMIHEAAEEFTDRLFYLKRKNKW